MLIEDAAKAKIDEELYQIKVYATISVLKQLEKSKRSHEEFEAKLKQDLVFIEKATSSDELSRFNYNAKTDKNDLMIAPFPRR